MLERTAGSGVETPTRWYHYRGTSLTRNQPHPRTSIGPVVLEDNLLDEGLVVRDGEDRALEGLQRFNHTVQGLRVGVTERKQMM